MTLYRKYRPTTFDEIVDNTQVIDTLRGLLCKEEKPHSYLIHGATGCGKTTVGRIIAKELGCIGMDFHEMDSADFRGIDSIRGIRKQSQFRAAEGSCRVWLLDEVHKLTNDAQNALLKALEETPSHVYYILCTTDPQKLLPTIRGRCSQFQVSSLGEKSLYRLLRRVVIAEGEILEEEVYEQIIQDSFGRPREALQILEQVLVVDSDKRLGVAEKSAETQSQSIELCRALLLSASGWRKVSNILAGLRQEDSETIRRHVVLYCESILLKGENDRAGLVLELFVKPFYDFNLILACYTVVRSTDEK